MSLLQPRSLGATRRDGHEVEAVPSWAEYFDRFASYLSVARSAIEAGGGPADGPDLARPRGPVPEEHAWTLFELLSEASCALDRAAAGRRGLRQACRALAGRALRARRKLLNAS